MSKGKINGFHVGIPALTDGIGAWLNLLGDGRVPFLCKAVDNTGSLLDGTTLLQQGKDGIVIYRKSVGYPGQSDDVPNYDAPATNEAERFWGAAKASFPPELDKSLVWLEIINEPDKAHSDWLGEFMYHASLLALQDGFKLLGLGWSAGEPEPTDWLAPGMQLYLGLCAQYPDRLGIALHEYSLHSDAIWTKKVGTDIVPCTEQESGYQLIGRFLQLHQACDQLGLNRPTIAFTEWGWSYTSIPGTDAAVRQIDEANRLYAGHPNIKGAAIWALDKSAQWQGISQKVHRLMWDNQVSPLGNLLLNTDYPGTTPPDPPPGGNDPTVPAKLNHRIHLLPQDTNLDELTAVAKHLHPQRTAFTYSADVCHAVMYAGTPQSEVHIWDAGRWQGSIEQWFVDRGIVNLVFHDFGDVGTYGIELPFKPYGSYYRVNQRFGVNGDRYPCCPGHDGIDFAVPYGAPFFAAQSGTVVHASNLTWTSGVESNYGFHVVIDHGGYFTVYAHAKAGLPVAVGEWVNAGDIVGYSGNTGSSTGAHLHFGLLVPYDTGNGFPRWKFGQAIDPAPFMVSSRMRAMAFNAGNSPTVPAKLNHRIHLLPQDTNLDELTAVVKHLHPQRTAFTYSADVCHAVMYAGTPQSEVTIWDESRWAGIRQWFNERGIVNLISRKFSDLDPQPPEPPPGGDGDCPLGIHASADMPFFYGGQKEIDEQAILQAGGIKFLSGHAPAAISQVMRVLRDPTAVRYVVRAFLDFGGRNVSPQQFYDWTASDVRRTVDTLKAFGVPDNQIWIELHNEPNLASEGAFYSWQNGFEFGQWLKQVISKYKASFVNPLVYPGLSPGDDEAGKLGDKTFFIRSLEAANLCDYIGVHAYWQNGHPVYPMPTALAHVDWYLANSNGKPIAVTEASNNRRDTVVSTAVYVNDYYAFWQYMRARARVKFLAYFVMSASNPIYSWESWVTPTTTKGIAQGLRSMLQ